MASPIPTQLSPGVNVSEIDLSQFVQPESFNSGGMVGVLLTLELEAESRVEGKAVSPGWALVERAVELPGWAINGCRTDRSSPGWAIDEKSGRPLSPGWAKGDEEIGSATEGETFCSAIEVCSGGVKGE
jgi:hypothetical protein